MQMLVDTPAALGVSQMTVQRDSSSTVRAG
jgi:hypothetical protein